MLPTASLTLHRLDGRWLRLHQFPERYGATQSGLTENEIFKIGWAAGTPLAERCGHDEAVSRRSSYTMYAPYCLAASPCHGSVAGFLGHAPSLALRLDAPVCESTEQRHQPQDQKLWHRGHDGLFDALVHFHLHLSGFP